MKRTLFLLIALIVGGVSPLFAQSLIGEWQLVSPAMKDGSTTLNFAANDSATLSISSKLERENIGTIYYTFSFMGRYNYNTPNCKFDFDPQTLDVDFNIQYNEAGKELLATDSDMEEELYLYFMEYFDEALESVSDDLCSRFSEKPFVVKKLTSDSLELFTSKTLHFVRVKTVK